MPHADKTTYYAVTRLGRHVFDAESDADAVAKATRHNGLRRDRLNSAAFDVQRIRRVDREIATTLHNLTDD